MTKIKIKDMKHLSLIRKQHVEMGCLKPDPKNKMSSIPATQTPTKFRAGI